MVVTQAKALDKLLTAWSVRSGTFISYVGTAQRGGILGVDSRVWFLAVSVSGVISGFNPRHPQLRHSQFRLDRRHTPRARNRIKNRPFNACVHRRFPSLGAKASQ